MWISEALAQTGPAAAPGGGDILMQMLPLALIVVVFYFLLIRPQMKRQKEHRKMVENVRRGDVVVTSGGIIGKIAKVDDGEVVVEIADGVRVRVVKATIGDVRTKTQPAVPADKDTAATK